MQQWIADCLGVDGQSARLEWPPCRADVAAQAGAFLVAEGKLIAALALADRSCQSSAVVDPRHLVLRATILRLAGATGEGSRDVARAVAIEPELQSANRHLLAHGMAPERVRAAAILLPVERDVRFLAMILSVLRDDGVTAAGRAAVVDGRIRGWVAWVSAEAIELTLEGDADEHRSARVEPQIQHPLAGPLGSAASFELSCSSAHSEGVWHGLSRRVRALRLQRRHFARGWRAPALEDRRSRGGQKVTVIMPVYLDAKATRLALSSLQRALCDEPIACDVIVVDDCSPDRGMRAVLESFPFRVLKTDENLGFVGAVNLALSHAGPGDVLLLNADTIVPPGFLGRLARIARSDAAIGTITPLTNNGELTSWPHPFTVNPTLSEEDVIRTDAAAAACNDGIIVDLPSGIGFCLYITEACLNAVGFLSEHFERGYGEDAHFCLSAREYGFRNVCATSVFVGHAGSRSFGMEKRVLVKRNLVKLEGWHPGHRSETALFMSLDPMRPARLRLGRLAVTAKKVRIATCGPAGARILARRGRDLVGDADALIVIVSTRECLLVRAIDATGGIYDRAEFEMPREMEDFKRFVGLHHIERVYFTDVAGLDVLEEGTNAVAEFVMLESAGLPSDGGLLVARAAQSPLALRPADDLASGFARHLGLAVGPPLWPLGARGKVERRSHVRIGFVIIAETMKARRLVADVSGSTVHGRLVDALVLGGTSDDCGLMRQSNVLVLGDFDPAELGSRIRMYEISHLVVINDRPLFGDPLFAAAWPQPVNLAFWDWSNGRTQCHADDLPVPMAASLEDCIEGITSWLGRTVSAAS